MQVRIVALNGLDRSGVVIFDKASGNGIYVTVTLPSTLNLEDWVIARRGLVAELLANDLSQIKFLPPIDFVPEPPPFDDDGDNDGD